MKRGQRIVDSRPDATRRRKPCSKIEAKLRLRRRSKLENKIDKSSRESPRILRKNNIESFGSFDASSSDNDDSPRFLTSKQHVELVNFESKRILPLPRVRKLSQKCAGTQDSFVKYYEEKDAAETRKSLSQTCVKKEKNLVRRSLTDAQLCKPNKLQINGINGGNDRSKILEEKGRKCNENLLRNSKYSIVRSINEEFANSLNKKRSRSAPCTPLFKIKCAKDKCPRNLLAERKSLAEKMLREEIRKLRKNRCKGLRISRSGEVAVNSCDALAEERIIERASLEAFETGEEDPEMVLIVKNGKFKEKDEETSINCDNCGNIEATRCQEKVTGNEIDSKVNLSVEMIFTEENSTKEKNVTGEEKSSKNEDLYRNSEIFETKVNAAIEENEERNLLVEESRKIVESVTRVVENEKKDKSPRKPPKKRAFKWETILEKQHRQTMARSPENRKSSPEILRERQEEENKLNFWSEKATNCSKYCRCPRSRVKSLENRKLEAYSRIREELPKILMKRRHAEAVYRIETGIQAVKSINLSPEREKETPKGHNSRFNSLLMENLVRERCNYRNNSIFDVPAKRLSPKMPNKLIKDCDSPLKSLILKDTSKIPQEGGQINPRSTIADTPRNSEELNENKCNRIAIASILKHRKTPSPRRVTFRLPGRVMNENLREEESNFTENFNEKEKIESHIREIDYSQMHEENIEENKKLEKKREKIVNNEENFVREKMRRHDRLLDTCIAEKARRFRATNLLNATGTEGSKKAQNVRWMSPRFLPNKEEQNCCECEDSEQDWETPTAEDARRASRDVSFPKETREAMKILLRAKENTLKQHCYKRNTDREAFRQRDSCSRAPNSPERISTLVSKSYAKALAKFQEGCDHEIHENLIGTARKSSQNRGSLKTYEAGGK